MENEELQKVMNESAGAEIISILLADTVGDKDLLAAYALKEKLGVKASIINIPDALQERWRFLFGAIDPAKKEVTLSLDVDKNPIEELRYEREGGRLKIYLSPQFPLHAQDFAFEESYHPSDMVIALGFHSKEELKNKLREVPLKNPEAIVTIGRATEEPPAPPAATHTSATPPSYDTLKLWARALLRSSLDAEGNIFWAFLPKEDFAKTNQTRESLAPLLESMRALTGFGGISVLLWQDPQPGNDQVQALLFAPDSEPLHHIAATLGMNPSSATSVTVGPYPSFSEAEVEIRKLLKSTP